MMTEQNIMYRFFASFGAIFTRRACAASLMVAMIVGLALQAAPGAAHAQVGEVAQDAAQPSQTTAKTLSDTRTVFGEWLFTGAFAKQDFVGFNPDYAVAIGDQIAVKLWGGFEYQDVLTVDNLGNIFVPKVGPVTVMGVRNNDLNEFVTQAILLTYKKNVGVYASLAGAEPVKVFVTGFVEKPGLYAGHSSDSVLHFLDMAGGIDKVRGSFISIDVLRQGRLLSNINLYDFILHGKLPAFQLYDGDTILVKAVRSQVEVVGLVKNPGIFEFEGDSRKVGDMLQFAQAKSDATHVRINRNNRAKNEVEYYPLDVAQDIVVNRGDVIEVISDKSPGTISVRVEGEHLSQQEFVLPYGAHLGELLNRITVTADADPASVQLFRTSVRLRQKDLLMAQLRALESSVLTARSGTAEEATLRVREAELILQWVERAKHIEPKGQIALAGSSVKNDILLEQGDIIRIPRKSQLVMVHGDVMFPNAVAFRDHNSINDYIEQAGGFTQSRGARTIMVLRRNGTFENITSSRLLKDKDLLTAGDEIFVLPRVQTKYLQIVKDFTQVLYQIAVSAGVVLRL